MMTNLKKAFTSSNMALSIICALLLQGLWFT